MKLLCGGIELETVKMIFLLTRLPVTDFITMEKLLSVLDFLVSCLQENFVII